MSVKSRKDNRLYVIAYDEQGMMTCTGRVEREDREMVRMETYDALDLILIGMFSLSGELVDRPRKQCRLFKTYEGFERWVAHGAQRNQADAQERLRIARGEPPFRVMGMEEIFGMGIEEKGTTKPNPTALEPVRPAPIKRPPRHRRQVVRIEGQRIWNTLPGMQETP